MSKLNSLIKENRELKQELTEMLEILKENEAKQKGFKVVEYAFLLSNSLKELDGKPLKYLEEIFEIDKAHLFVNKDIFDFDSEDGFQRISFAYTKTFTYFFLEKRPYSGSNKINMIEEFDIYENTESYLISPLIENDKVVGSLNLYSSNPQKFPKNYSPDFVKDLTLKISITLRKIHDSDFIAKQSRIDDMTGCYNKLAMNEFIDFYVKHHMQSKQQFCFLMFDLDNFKTINDTKGHLTGDEIIIKIGEALKNNFRKSDIIGRFGGDEFYMLIPDCGYEDKKLLTKKITKLVKKVLKKYGFESNVGVSGGLVTIPEDFSGEINADTILKLADNRLYMGKNKGKGMFIGANDDIL